MSELEKIQRYIERTGFSDERYNLRWKEAMELLRKGDKSPAEAIILAYDYGCAKGYRAAKAEGRV